MIKFENLDDALNRLVRNIENSKKDYTLLATKEAERIFKKRVFGYGSKDIDGATLPTYSKGYAAKKNKRSSTWDLQDTLDLRDSIQTITKSAKKHTVLMFVDSEQIKKADSLEARSGQTIFEISDKERKQILKYVADEMIRDVRKIIKESFK